MESARQMTRGGIVIPTGGVVALRNCPTKSNVTGITKTALFKGLHLKMQFSFKAASSTNCVSTPLAKVSVTGTKPVIVK